MPIYLFKCEKCGSIDEAYMTICEFEDGQPVIHLGCDAFCWPVIQAENEHASI